MKIGKETRGGPRHKLQPLAGHSRDRVGARAPAWISSGSRHRTKAAIEAAPVTARLLAKERGKDSAWAASQVEQFESLAANYLVRRDSAALKPDIRPLPATPP